MFEKLTENVKIPRMHNIAGRTPEMLFMVFNGFSMGKDTPDF